MLLRLSLRSRSAVYSRCSILALASAATSLLAAPAVRAGGNRAAAHCRRGRNARGAAGEAEEEGAGRASPARAKGNPRPPRKAMGRARRIDRIGRWRSHRPGRLGGQRGHGHRLAQSANPPRRRFLAEPPRRLGQRPGHAQQPDGRAHSRRREQSHAGAHRRRRGQLGDNRWVLRLLQSRRRRDRADRGAARSPGRHLRHGCHRRRRQHHHQVRQGSAHDPRPG